MARSYIIAALIRIRYAPTLTSRRQQASVSAFVSNADRNRYNGIGPVRPYPEWRAGYTLGRTKTKAVAKASASPKGQGNNSVLGR